jgi:hypothetical protein
LDPTPLIDRVLDDEGLTSGLDEPEAMLLLRALTDRVRAAAMAATDGDVARQATESLCRRARQIAAEVRAAKTGQAGPALRRLLAQWPDRPA